MVYLNLNNKVRGTQEEVLPIEVNVDTVYVRENIARIEDDDFVGWEYDETQFSVREYIALISERNIQSQEKILELKTEVFKINQVVASNGILQQELIELIMELESMSNVI